MRRMVRMRLLMAQLMLRLLIILLLQPGRVSRRIDRALAERRAAPVGMVRERRLSVPLRP